MWRELFSRKERKERKDCGRVDVGDVLTQRRRDAEYAERFEPRNTLNTRNAKTTQGLRPIHLRRRDERVTKLTTEYAECTAEEGMSVAGGWNDEMSLMFIGVTNG